MDGEMSGVDGFAWVVLWGQTLGRFEPDSALPAARGDLDEPHAHVAGDVSRVGWFDSRFEWSVPSMPPPAHPPDPLIDSTPELAARWGKAGGGQRQAEPVLARPPRHRDIYRQLCAELGCDPVGENVRFVPAPRRAGPGEDSERRSGRGRHADATRVHDDGAAGCR